MIPVVEAQITLLAIFGTLLFLLFLVLWSISRSRLKTLQHEFSAVTSELKSLKTKFAPAISLEARVDDLGRKADILNENIDEIRSTYAEKRKLLESLEQQVAIYDEHLSFAAFGLYEPHFEFDDSNTYKEDMKSNRALQKSMVSAKEATYCPANWTVDGSQSKGRVMINRQTRLTLRAFNSECAAAIANTRWNNVVAMEKRILNAAKQINSANSSMQLGIEDEYVSLKLRELHLTHEYREKLKAEREERAEYRRAEREKKKLLAESRAAEREEHKYQALLDRARMQAGVDESRIAELETALEEAHAKSERAKSMAQMTKSGYVYIVSNIGSFGEDVVKIGLTRRVDPDDRVRELGDASVPFRFDTHAMIYSDDAPELEFELHRVFSDRRVNEANLRKEFFKVSLEEVEDAVRHLAPDANFFRDREAQEWHETLARRKQVLADMELATDKFPKGI